jgi:hypothetical protein
MWDWFLGLLKGLFGGVGGDVHSTHRARSGQAPEGEQFTHLEETMPDLFDDLARLLVETPLTRDLIVLPRHSIASNWPHPHIRLVEDEDPGVTAKVQILEREGLVRDITGERFGYRMTERLVRYLKGRPGSKSPGPDRKEK